MEQPPSLEMVAQWMIQRAPHLRAWPQGRVVEWLDWWCRCRCMGVIRDRGRIMAVGIAYPCTFDQIGRHWNVPNRRGEYLMVEALVADPPRAALGLFIALNRLFPDWRQRKIIGFRHGGHRPFKARLLQRWSRILSKPLMVPSHES